jgi:hypothetical protein
VIARNVARMEEGMSPFKIVTGKPTVKMPLGMPCHRWEDKFRKDITQICINRKWTDST